MTGYNVSGANIVLLKQFIDADYNVLVSTYNITIGEGTSGFEKACGVQNKTSNGFRIDMPAGANYATIWLANGYTN